MSNFIDKLIFNCDDNECFVGSKNDEDSWAATGITDNSYQGSAVIPKYYQGKPITYIGYFAFYGCSYITEVSIEARVKAMYKYAFGHMPSLWSINIPSSCTFLGSQSIYSYNNSNAQDRNAIGTLVISFEINSKLETIDANAFGRKERIILIMCERIRSLKNVNSLFYSNTKYFEIYPPFSFFCREG